MADEHRAPATPAFRLLRQVDAVRDHVQGGTAPGDIVTLLLYGDYLCPYCRRLRHVLVRLREALGDRFAFVFRHYPNERAHPGATALARASEAAGRQGRFFEMHDLLYEHTPPLTAEDIHAFARSLGLDMASFERDLADDTTRRRIQEDLADGRRNGVIGTPTVFIDGVRYDGAWDFYSMLEALERPLAARVERSARAFASLPAAGGFVLLVAAATALVAANTPLAPYYQRFVDATFGLGMPGSMLSMSVKEWFSQGLLAIFFLLVGLEIRREMTAGALSDHRAAALPVVAALGGVIVPAAIYLMFNRGPTAAAWAVPTATDLAFALGILAMLGDRVTTGLRALVAAIGVVDDLLSLLILAIFYPRAFEARWLLAAAAAAFFLFALNRWRVYVAWPYVVVTMVLGLFFQAAGVDAALVGVVLAASLPTRPAPAVGPLLGQAATALAALEQAEREATRLGGETRRIQQEPIWDWASRNLSAASERLLSPADRIERLVAPWSAYLVLPLFAFSAAGIDLTVDTSSPDARRILLGVVLGLFVGKPLGVSLASWLAIKTGMAMPPDDVTPRLFVGAACLCGIGDMVALLIADQAFVEGPESAIAKLGVLIGSILATGAGVLTLWGVRENAGITPVVAEEPARAFQRRPADQTKGETS